MPHEEEYNIVQREIRGHLKSLLKRLPPRIPRADFELLFNGVKDPARLRQHLFVEHQGYLEWKADVTTRELSAIKNCDVQTILAAYNRSHRQQFRTAYPYIAVANKVNLHRDWTHEEGQCYGFDILVRRPTSHIPDHGERSLSIGDLSFAFVIHTQLPFRAGDGANVFSRAVWGDSLRRYRLWENLRDSFVDFELEIPSYLEVGNYFGLCEFAVVLANKAAAMSFPV